MLHRYQNDFIKITVSFFECLGSLVGVKFEKLKVYDNIGNIFVFYLDSQEVHIYEEKKKVDSEGK